MALDNAKNELRSVLEKYKAERARLDEQIRSLEAIIGDLAPGAPAPRKRGRPRKDASLTVEAPAPKAPKAAAASSGGSRKRRKPNWSPEARAAARERMRKIWQDRRKR